MISLQALEDLLRDQPSKPPVENWHPPLSGDMDMRIDTNGDWYHEGVRIQRQSLVNLFASILRREDDGHHYLLTPVEKWRIQVDDAPLLAVDADSAGEDEQTRWMFTLNTGERVLLDTEHALIVKSDAVNAEPRPYLQLDRGLRARINRALFYRLVESAETAGEQLGLRSAGHWFVLGDL